MYKYNEDSLLTNVSDNVPNKNNSYVRYNSNGSIFRMSNDHDNLGRNTNTYLTYLEDEKLYKKKIQEIEYKNLYDDNNHLIGVHKIVKILTSEETFDMITYEYDKYDRLVKIYEI